MRNISKLLSISFILCISYFNLAAGTDTSFSVTTDENNYLVVNVNTALQEDIEVTIKDSYGAEIYSETIDANKIRNRKYDINDIKDGIYTLLLELDNEIKVQKIKKANQNIEIFSEDRFKVFKPTIQENNGVVSVTMLQFHGDFEIKIYDQDGKIIFKEEHDARGSFKSRYNLTTLPGGNYNFIIDVEQEDFDGSFNKNIPVTTGIASL
jgi:hypothetical protein